MMPSFEARDIVIIIVIGFFLIRRMRERRISVRKLWILPAVVLFLSIQYFWFAVDHPGGIAAEVFGFALGALFGVMSAKVTQLSFDTEKREVISKGTQWTFAFIFVLFALKTLLRSFVGPGHQFFQHATVSSAFFLAIAFATLTTRNVTIYLRFRRQA